MLVQNVLVLHLINKFFPGIVRTGGLLYGMKCRNRGSSVPLSIPRYPYLSISIEVLGGVSHVKALVLGLGYSPEKDKLFT